jgi:hypothetical protein
MSISFSLLSLSLTLSFLSIFLFYFSVNHIHCPCLFLLILLSTWQVGAEMANVTGLCGCLFFIWSYKYARHLLLYANSLGKKTSCDNLLPTFNYNIFFVQRNINIKIKELSWSYSFIICLCLCEFRPTATV